MTKHCLMCPKQVSPRARTCGSTCRKAASRLKKVIERDIAAFEAAFELLMEHRGAWPDLEAEVERSLRQSVTQICVTPDEQSTKRPYD